MKITTISHMVLKEYKKHFLFSISMFIILDFIYINFVGLSINRTNAYIAKEIIVLLAPTSPNLMN